MESIINSVRAELSGKTLEEKGEKVDTNPELSIKINVVGVGGAGSNTVTRLKMMGIKSATTIAINTDSKHLYEVAKADKKILIGKSLTRGLGAGGDPSIARKSAEADKKLIEDVLEGSELVFIAAGMGGGTGTGAAPVVAQVAKDMGAITIGIVTYPFNLERARLKKAQEGIRELLPIVDTLIIIDNNRLASYAPNLPIDKAFELADTIIGRAVKGITDLIVLPSLINVDFADVKAVMSTGGLSMISIGEGVGPNKVEKAIESTLTHPLLDVDYENANGGLIHIEGAESLTLGDAISIAEGIAKGFNPEGEVKMGARINPELNDMVRVTAIITGVKSPQILGTGVKKEETELFVKEERLDDLLPRLE